MVVIRPPRFDFAPGIVDRQELVGVQAFVPQLAVERLNEAVLRRLSGSDEVERDASAIGPFIQRARSELSAVVHGDRPGFSVLRDRSVQGFCNAASGEIFGHLQDWTPATPLIDDRQHPKRSTIEQRIMDKIHAPSLMGPTRCRWNTAVLARMLSPTQLVPQLQAFQAIKTPYALHVHRPALTHQHDVNTSVTESRTCLGDFTHALPQPGLARPP